MIKFFVSGNYNKGSFGILEYLVATESAVLTSFAYRSILRERTPLLAEECRRQGKRMEHMIDSGAFTAWSSGKVIDLEQYCDTCNDLLQQYGDVMDFTFVALDKIPGEKGRPMTAEDRLEACKISAANYHYMCKHVEGFVKPVFHTGDPDWLLMEYADADYISFGMSQQWSEDERVAWAAANAHKVEGRKLHGLAATGYRMLRAAPWYSVDSAAWQYCASMGGINWVRPSGRIMSIAISQESPKQKDFDQHFLTMSKLHQEMLIAEMEKLGTTIDELSREYAARWKVNIHMYRKACEMASVAPQTAIQGGLFDA